MYWLTGMFYSLFNCTEKLTEVSFRALPHLLPVPPQRAKKRPKVHVECVEKMLFFEVQVYCYFIFSEREL